MSENGAKDAPRSSNRVSNRLLSASCAAVIAVYTAGYVRTQPAAERLTERVAERRPAISRPAATAASPASPAAEFHPAEQSVSIAQPAPAELPAPAPAWHRNDSSEPVAPKAVVAPSAAERGPEAPPVETAAPSLPAASAAAPAAAPVIEQVADAAAAPEEVKKEAPPAAPSASAWKDGTYTGWGYSRHGNIEAQVVIDGGRIASAIISQCRTRYSCSVIEKLPPEVAQRQSPNVDYVSGATQSADAFYGAVVEALNKAK